MSVYKKAFGYFLVVFSLIFIILIGMPQLYMGESAGRISKEIPLELEFLKGEDAKVVLLYFGYAGCETICTPSLHEISEIYTQIQSKNISVYFINLLDTTPQELPQQFAKHFHQDFHGIYLNTQELQKLQNTINIAFTKSLTNEFELNHAGHLYLLEKNKTTYTQKYIYNTRPFNKKLLIEDIQHLLN